MEDKKASEESIVKRMSGSVPAPENVDFSELLTEALIEKYLNKQNRISS